MLKKLSLNPTDKQVYIIHPKAMTIVNLLDIICTTEYNHSWDVISFPEENRWKAPTKSIIRMNYYHR